MKWRMLAVTMLTLVIALLAMTPTAFASSSGNRAWNLLTKPIGSKVLEIPALAWSQPQIQRILMAASS